MAGKSSAALREEAPVVEKKAKLKAVRSKERTGPKLPSTFEVEHWGLPPEGASLFGILRKNDDGVGERKRSEAPGTGVEVTEWPLSELSVDFVRERWGGGAYTPIWLGLQNGVRVSLGRGRQAFLRGAERPVQPAVEPVPVPASIPTMPAMPVIPPGVGAQETISMFMSMWTALQEAGRHTQTLERESFEARLKLQQDFYKEVTNLKTGGSSKGVGELEKKLDALAERLEEEDDDEPRTIVRGAPTVGAVLAQHIPTLLEHLPGFLSLMRDALKSRKGVVT